MVVLEEVYTALSPTQREKAFEEWYELAFPLVARFVSKMDGSFQDAKDVFQDALVLFYEKTLEPQFYVQSREEAYILGIAKHLWLRKFQKDKHRVSLDAFEASLSLSAPVSEDVDTLRLMRILERSGKKCMELLRTFYYETLSIKEISLQFGYQNARSATVQKYKCLEKVRNTVKEKSMRYEDFME